MICGAKEDVNISTFGNFQTLSKSIDPVLLVAKTNNHENILIKSLCLPMLCLPISSASIRFLKGQFEKFHGIEFVDENSEKDITDLGGLLAVETKFGCILSGCVGVGGKTQSVNFVSSATSEVRIGGANDELESQLKRFGNK